jgi:hypothetical protein
MGTRVIRFSRAAYHVRDLLAHYSFSSLSIPRNSVFPFSPSFTTGVSPSEPGQFFQTHRETMALECIRDAKSAITHLVAY